MIKTTIRNDKKAIARKLNKIKDLKQCKKVEVLTTYGMCGEYNVVIFVRDKGVVIGWKNMIVPIDAYGNDDVDKASNQALDLTNDLANWLYSNYGVKATNENWYLLL